MVEVPEAPAALPNLYSRLEGLRISIFARSGHGKSMLARYHCEKLLESGFQIAVFEPISEWDTLREEFSNVVVAGGSDPDVPLSSRAVDLLREGASIIFNMQEAKLSEVRAIAKKILERIYSTWKSMKRPLVIVFEEAQIYAPQRLSRHAMPLLDTVDLIAKTGRKIGISYMLISQRPASVSKDIVSQSNVIYAGAVSDPRDAKALRDYISTLGFRIQESTLSNLSTGEFIEAVSGFEDYRVVSAPRTRSRHAGATPDLVASKPARVDERIRRLIDELNRAGMDEELDVVEVPRVKLRALEDRIRELEEENQRLKSEIEKYRLKLETIEIIAEKIKAVGRRDVDVDVGELSDLEKRILEELKRSRELPLHILARKAGTTRKSYRFRLALRRLSSEGLIEYSFRRGRARILRA